MIQPSFLPSGRPVLAVMLLAAVLTVSHGVPTAKAQSSDSLEVYLNRINALEEGLKDVRGSLETELRAISQSLQSGGSLSAGNAQILNDNLQKLSDQIASINNRLERTLAAVSDNEFRLLRLEKRMESVMRLGIDQQIDGTALTDSGTLTDSGALNETGVFTEPGTITDLTGSAANTTAEDVPESTLNTATDLSPVWTLGGDASGEITAGNNTASSETDILTLPAGTGVSEEETFTEPSITALEIETAPEVAGVLPDDTPEEQYQFALGKALQNDLETAEKAFEEFIATHTDHDRTADAHFWLGRMQFQRGSHEKSVKTFSNFQIQWPNDSRIEKTTLWIGEAVANFASQEDACELLSSLPSFVPDPTESFFVRLDNLKAQVSCS